MFAFTLDICFYFENIGAKEHWRLQRFSHMSTEFKIIQLKIIVIVIELMNFKLVYKREMFVYIYYKTYYYF